MSEGIVREEVLPMRLTAIVYRFPAQIAGSVDLFNGLAALLAPVSGVDFFGGMLHLVPHKPVGALPITVFALGEGATPEIAFATDLPIDLTIGALRLRGTGPQRARVSSSTTIAGASPLTVTMEDVVARLAGQITHIDHTGVNLPLDSTHWEALVHALAQAAALYRYPEGEPWPFILPTSDEEYTDEIYRFAGGRWPKFELVHDTLTNVPLIQIALGTTLTRAALEGLFPAPHGVAFPGLGEFFRTIYVQQPWPELLLRLDLYYASSGIESDWDTGQWLVEAGGRIR